MFEINGKVCLITGGAKGIGLSCAKELLKNGLKGVSLIDIDVENGEKAADQLRKEYGENSAIYIKTDVTNEHELEDAFKQTIETFQQLDIVINNAGIVHEIQWRRSIAINLEAVIACSKLAMEKYLPNFKSSSEGVIINIASALGLSSIEAIPIYVSTKHGIVGYGRSIGGPIHYRKYKVRVITICPGLTDTRICVLTEEQQIEPFRTVLSDILKSAQIQSTEKLASNLVPIIQEASLGTVWLINNGHREQVKFTEDQ